MSTKQEYIVDGGRFPRKTMHEIKELLLKNNTLTVVAGTRDASSGAKVCETLRSLGYVNITNITTTTVAENERTIIKLIITLEKASNFDKLYKENEEKRKAYHEEREAKKTETKKE